MMADTHYDDPPLEYPLMYKDVYHFVVDELKDQLKPRFGLVHAPFENPHKAEYQTITIYAAEYKGAEPDVIPTHLSDLLPKTKRLYGVAQKDPFTVEFAVDWPSDRAKYPVPGSESRKLASALMWRIRYHIRVSLKVWMSTQDLREFRRVKINGEINKMLGLIIKTHGLTYNSNGLFLRIQEIEKVDKPLSCVRLTNNKRAIWNFLGVEPGKNYDDLKTWEDLMDYATTCRFFNPALYNPRRKKTPLHGQVNIFDYFTEIYLPAQAKINRQPGGSALLTREEVIEQARQDPRFGNQFADAYDKSIEAKTLEANHTKFWRDLRKYLPRYVKKPELTYIVKGLARAIKDEAHDHVGDQESQKRAEAINGGTDPKQFEGYSLTDLGLVDWDTRGIQAAQEAYDKGSDEMADLVLNQVDWMYAGALQKWYDTAKSAKEYKYHMDKEAEKEKKNEAALIESLEHSLMMLYVSEKRSTATQTAKKRTTTKCRGAARTRAQ